MYGFTVNAVLSLKTLIILHTVDVVLNLFKTVFILLKTASEFEVNCLIV